MYQDTGIITAISEALDIAPNRVTLLSNEEDTLGTTYTVIVSPNTLEDSAAPLDIVKN